MSAAIGASLAGAAVFAVAAIWLSLQGWLARRSSTFGLVGDTMKMLAAGVIAIGLCLVATSVAVTAGLSTGLACILALMTIPLIFIVIWRSVDIATRTFDGDRTGGVASGAAHHRPWPATEPPNRLIRHASSPPTAVVRRPALIFTR